MDFVMQIWAPPGPATAPREKDELRPGRSPFGPRGLDGAAHQAR
jgi:hypothetical protein